MKFDTIEYVVKKVAKRVIRHAPHVRLFEHDGISVFRRVASDSAYITLVYEPPNATRRFVSVSFDYYIFQGGLGVDRLIGLIEHEIERAVEQLLNGATVKEPAENEFGVVSP